MVTKGLSRGLAVQATCLRPQLAVHGEEPGGQVVVSTRAGQHVHQCIEGRLETQLLMQNITY